jgi:5-methylcytosine-specific restriction endonuclease McrA
MRKRNFDDPIYKDWRLSVYKRDKFTCQMPGCKSKRQIQAHHIRKWSTASALRYDLDNGITLCRQCHDSISKSEEYYEALFIDIVRSKK